jgi:hypothetical protein
MNRTLKILSSVGAMLVVLLVAGAAYAGDCRQVWCWFCFDREVCDLSVDVRLEGYQQQDVHLVDATLKRVGGANSMSQAKQVVIESSPASFRVADFIDLDIGRYHFPDPDDAKFEIWIRLFRHPSQLVDEHLTVMDFSSGHEDFALTVEFTKAQGAREEIGQFTGFALGSYASWLRNDPISGDSDGDGVAAIVDRCPGTPAGTETDSSGCSQEQFCLVSPVSSSAEGRACRRADWRNDEPTMRSRDRDCQVDRHGTTGRSDDTCESTGAP